MNSRKHRCDGDLGPRQCGNEQKGEAAALPSLAQVRHLGSKARVRSTPAAARDPMAANGP